MPRNYLLSLHDTYIYIDPPHYIFDIRLPRFDGMKPATLPTSFTSSLIRIHLFIAMFLADMIILLEH